MFFLLFSSHTYMYTLICIYTGTRTHTYTHSYSTPTHTHALKHIDSHSVSYTQTHIHICKHTHIDIPTDVVANDLDCGLEVNVFKLQSRYYVHFRAKILRKGMKVFANGPGDLGSIPGRVIPKT